jgi:hypothetical protein
MEPISMLIVLGAVGIGFIAGRRTRKPKPVDPLKPICGCTHGLHSHDPKTKKCNASVSRAVYNKRGDWIGKEWVGCSCMQYTGPMPLDQLWIPDVLPPASSD